MDTQTFTTQLTLQEIEDRLSGLESVAELRTLLGG